MAKMSENSLIEMHLAFSRSEQLSEADDRHESAPDDPDELSNARWQAQENVILSFTKDPA
jgi:hypothetical protein